MRDPKTEQMAKAFRTSAGPTATARRGTFVKLSETDVGVTLITVAQALTRYPYDVFDR